MKIYKIYKKRYKNKIDKKKLQKVLKDFFIDHSLWHYSASLSFHTILSLIPILLISFYFFTKLQIFNDYLSKVKDLIFSYIIPANKDIIISNIDSFMTNTSHLGIVGVVFIIYVSVMFFDDFEFVVNKIFKTTPRRFLHSISIYLLISILMPILMSMSIFLSLKAKLFVQINFAFISYLLVWFLFFILYKISANRKVHTKAALLSSFLASSAWSLSKYIFIIYITYNQTYKTIYGSFSVVMFFLIWLYISWIIFLYGVKLCYYLNQKFDK